MNELVTDIKSLELETLKNLRNSKAANTLRAYQSDFKDFSVILYKKWFKFNAYRTKNSINLSNPLIIYLKI